MVIKVNIVSIMTARTSKFKDKLGGMYCPNLVGECRYSRILSQRRTEKGESEEEQLFMPCIWSMLGKDMVRVL